MINTIEITTDSQLAELRKLFRKKLMTGGAVFKLAAGLELSDLRDIFERFVEGVTRYNMQGMVLVEIARHPALDAELMQKLASLELVPLRRALLSRNDLAIELREELMQSAVDVRDAEIAVTVESERIKSFIGNELRRYFMAHLGDESTACIGRLALCRHSALPDDLRKLLRRDQDNRVRFAAGYRVADV